MTTTERLTRPQPVPRRRRSTARRVPPMPRHTPTAPVPRLHQLHGPWPLTVVQADPAAPPLTATTW